MKLKTRPTVSNPHLMPNTIYEVLEPLKGCYMTSDAGVVEVSDFLSIREMLEELIKAGAKTCIYIPCSGKTVELLLTEDHIIVYAHTKGNYYNVFGNHYYSAHCIETGEFVDYYDSISDMPILLKERLLKADAIKLNKLSI